MKEAQRIFRIVKGTLPIYKIMMSPLSGASILIGTVFTFFLLNVIDYSLTTRIVQINQVILTPEILGIDLLIITLTSIVIVLGANMFKRGPRLMSVLDALTFVFLTHYCFLSDKFTFCSWIYPFVIATYYLYLLLFIPLWASAKREHSKKSGSTFLISDDPIERFATNEDDPLGRKAFAEHLLSACENLDLTKRAYVIGVEGRWGTGKTSLLNLIRNENRTKIKVLNFNPWYFSDFESLLKSYLEFLHKELDIDHQLLKEYRTVLSETERSLFSTTLIENLSGTETIEASKKKINSSMNLRPHPVLITIDDLDRLTKEEMYHVFRLIRIIADFKNIIYMVFYDRDFVVKSIDELFQNNMGDEINGKEKDNKRIRAQSYLEKIFQVTFQIPNPPNQIVLEVFFETLSQVVMDRAKSELESIKTDSLEYKKKEQLIEGLKLQLGDIRKILENSVNHFTDLRQAKRFINNLLIRYFAQFGEIDLADLFCLHLLENFYPAEYDKIHAEAYKQRNINLLFESTTAINVDALIHGEDPRDQLLFKIRDYLKVADYGNSLVIGGNLLRYFQLSGQSHQIGIFDFLDLIELIENNDREFMLRFNKIFQQGKEISFSHKLKSNDTLISTSELNVLLKSTYEISKEYEIPLLESKFSAVNNSLVSCFNKKNEFQQIARFFDEEKENDTRDVCRISFLHDSIFEYYMDHRLYPASSSKDHIRSEIRDLQLDLLKNLILTPFEPETFTFLLKRTAKWSKSKDWTSRIFYDSEIANWIGPNLGRLFQYLENSNQFFFGKNTTPELKKTSFESLFGDKKALKGNPNFTSYQKEIDEFLSNIPDPDNLDY